MAKSSKTRQVRTRCCGEGFNSIFLLFARTNTSVGALCKRAFQFHFLLFAGRLMRVFGVIGVLLRYLSLSVIDVVDEDAMVPVTLVFA